MDMDCSLKFGMSPVRVLANCQSQLRKKMAIMIITMTA
jgi:hypothetical protein